MKSLRFAVLKVPVSAVDEAGEVTRVIVARSGPRSVSHLRLNWHGYGMSVRRQFYGLPFDIDALCRQNSLKVNLQSNSEQVQFKGLSAQRGTIQQLV